MPEQAISERPENPAPAGVVAVGHAGRVFLLDATTGRTLWERALAEIPGASACDGQPVEVRLGASSVLAGAIGHVFALGLEDGSVLWHVDRRQRGDGDTCLAIERN